MDLDERKTNKEGESLIVKFNDPLFNVVGIEEEVEGEIEDVYFYREYRFSVDGFSFTDWSELKSEWDERKQKWITSFNDIVVTSKSNNRPLFFQLKYTQIGEQDDVYLEFIGIKSVELNNNLCMKPRITCCDANSIMQTVVFNQCGCNEMFNPYNLGQTNQLYMQMCGVISNMFGFCVQYFKTAEDQKSRDVILKEYSLYNVIDTQNVKILIPDNALPERNIQYNPLMLDFPVQFEVHIVKSAFENAFGVGTHPQQHDYLYFEQYMNRMYEIDAVAQPDDVIFAEAYWRVSLVPYQKRQAVGFDSPDLEIETNDIVTNIEDVFKEERENEFDDARKPNQYNEIGTKDEDYVRNYLNKNVVIENNPLYQKYNMISKYCYNLSSIPSGDVATTYRNIDRFGKDENKAISFFLMPNNVKKQKSVITFDRVEKYDDNNDILVAKYPINDIEKQTKYKQIKIGDTLKIVQTRKNYDVVNCYLDGTEYRIELNTNSLSSDLTGITCIKQNIGKSILQKGNDFSISFNNGVLHFSICGNEFDLNELTKLNKNAKFQTENGLWYTFVINLNNLTRKINLFVYALYFDEYNRDSYDKKSLLHYLGNKQIEMNDNFEFGDDLWTLYGTDCKFTNFRSWKAPIEQEEQISVLSQYIVNDTHLSVIVDNAAPEILLSKVINR